MDGGKRFSPMVWLLQTCPRTVIGRGQQASAGGQHILQPIQGFQGLARRQLVGVDIG